MLNIFVLFINYPNNRSSHRYYIIDSKHNIRIYFLSFLTIAMLRCQLLFFYCNLYLEKTKINCLVSSSTCSFLKRRVSSSSFTFVMTKIKAIDTLYQMILMTKNHANDIQWIEPDVTSYHFESFSNGPYLRHSYAPCPMLAHVFPIEIHIPVREMLYLPSFWFHRVTQNAVIVWRQRIGII